MLYVYVCFIHKENRKFFQESSSPIVDNNFSLRTQDLTYLGRFTILGFSLGGSKRVSDKEEERTFQPVGITVVTAGERTFCVLETARVVGMLG